MKPLSIPQFVSARTPEDLIEEMRNAMFRHKMKLEFYSIQFAQGKWYAWYNIPRSRENN